MLLIIDLHFNFTFSNHGRSWQSFASTSFWTSNSKNIGFGCLKTKPKKPFHRCHKLPRTVDFFVILSSNSQYAIVNIFDQKRDDLSNPMVLIFLISKVLVSIFRHGSIRPNILVRTLVEFLISRSILEMW